MKSTFLKIGLGLCTVAAIVAVTVLPHNSFADPVTYDVTGQAFSDMPDSADQGKTPDNHYGGRGLGYINMKGSNYAVTLNPTTGAFGGYGWSEFGGYVEFAPVGLAGASIVPSCLNIKTNECPVSGYIRYVSHTDPQSGGWDGQVKMSDPSWTNGVKLGKEIAGVRAMSGYAWGGDVVGWVDFSNVKILIKDLCTNMPGVQNPIPAGYHKIPATPVDQPGECYPDEDAYSWQNDWKGCRYLSGSNYLEDPINITCKRDRDELIVDDSFCTDPRPIPRSASNLLPLCEINDICENITGIQLTPADIPPGYAQATDGTKICPETTCVPGKPCDKCWNVGGVQLSVPSPYNTVYPTNQCVIAGCTDSRDTTHYNPAATVDNGTCSICDANSPAWNPVSNKCERCNPSTPGYVDGKCPKGPIKPIYIES
jgi:hypothetical protein